MTDVLERLGELGVVPVIAIDDAERAAPLGAALLAGGLPCAEITFRTAAAADAIWTLAAEYPKMLVGAGTVLSVEQAQQAAEAGARFIVSPGFDPAVVDWCLANDLPVTPGVVTPTEITAALNKGLHVLKFFPAEASGGLKVLKANGGPFKTVKFIPTGGIGPDNLAEYLSHPIVHACGGSWLAKSQLIASGDFDEITRRTAEAVETVRRVRA
jgi:2-dehydro-3-deoxyphosphogluconate aldolase/(4S)-4-hydroxy-2-oxoglutarate aldolase